MFGNKLNLYTVHTRPEDSGSEKLPIFIGEGFNFYAFVFAAFWLLYHRLWLPLLLVLAINSVIPALVEFEVIHPASGVLLGLVFQLWIGFEGNDWRRKSLKRKGYVLHAMVSGANSLQAEQRYFDRLIASRG